MDLPVQGVGDIGVVRGGDQHLGGTCDDPPQSLTPAGVQLAEHVVEDQDRLAITEVAFLEPDAPDWETIGKALDLALYNYLEGRGLDKKATDWKRLAKRSRR